MSRLVLCFMLLLPTSLWADSITSLTFSGVNVGGTLYNVSIQRGNCVSVFNGCDSMADLPFQDAITANAANLALATVLTDFGITIQGFVVLPYLTTGDPTIFPPDNHIGLASLLRFSSDGTASVTAMPFDFMIETNYAKWSTLPAPSTLLLLGIAMLGLGLRYKR